MRGLRFLQKGPRMASTDRECMFVQCVNLAYKVSRVERLVRVEMVSKLAFSFF